MKKIFYLALLLVSSMTSCQKFLEHEPYGIEGSAEFWKTDEDVESALNAFNEFVSYEGTCGRGMMWFENCSDNLVTGRPQAQAANIKNFVMSANNGRDVKDTWPWMFQQIAKANDVLRNIKDMTIKKEGLRDRAIGESRFYRALCYLWIAPFYGDNGPNGGIPIVTEDTPVTKLDQPRPSSVLVNYDMIIEDMRVAGEKLPLLSEIADDQYGRPHKAAAWAFAARAALYAAQYDAKYFDTVLEFTQKVMSLTGSDKRELFPSFSELWLMKNNFSSEYLFSIFGNEKDGPKFHGMSFENGGWGKFNTWGYFQPTLELFKAYEQGDERRTATILYPGEKITFIGEELTYGIGNRKTTSSSGMTFRKFMDPFKAADAIGKTVNSNGNYACNRLGMCLIRYADVLLMRAEALIWKNGEGNAEAKTLLNAIRKRAGLAENSNATKAELKHERRCELAFEFQPSRHLDLVRWGDAKEAYAKPLHGVEVKSENPLTIVEKEIWPARNFDPQKNHVFPIPEKEINKSKNLKQNLGY